MYAAIATEIRATLALAAPLAAANLAQMAMGVTDTVMVGTLGGVALAAVGLGGGFYFLGAIVCQGALNAVAPLSAFAIGGGDRRAAGRIAASGMVLAALLVAPVVCLLLAVEPALQRLGYDPALADEIGRFLRAIAWGTPAFLGFAVLRSLLASMGRARVVMIVLALCVPTLAGLNWILIFGHLGMPALGVVGCGYASAVNQWLMALGLAAALWAAPRDDPARRLAASRQRILGDLRRILTLGLPIAGLQALEMGVFIASAALMGLFGTEALAAHQIAINVASTTFMVPLGIGQAATVRIAAERGAGNPAVARGAGYVALAMGGVFMAASAVAMWTLTRPIIGAYVALTDPANAALIDWALTFLRIAALFQVVDGLQVVAAGALRGYEDTKVPMLFAALGYWVIGFVGGWVWAFPLHGGPSGLWWGFVLGLGTVAALLTRRLVRQSRRALL